MKAEINKKEYRKRKREKSMEPKVVFWEKINKVTDLS